MPLESNIPTSIKNNARIDFASAYSKDGGENGHKVVKMRQNVITNLGIEWRWWWMLPMVYISVLSFSTIYTSFSWKQIMLNYKWSILDFQTV